MDESEIVIYTLAAIAILIAVAAFIRTPMDKKYSFSATRYEKEEGVEYAPEYTKQERLKYLVVALGIFTPLFALTKYWFFPWLTNYAEHAHCYDYGAYTGTHVLFYGLFVGLPLIITLVIFTAGGFKQIRIFRLGQFPLPNDKVFTPTKYIYGNKAKIRPVLFFVILSYSLGLSIYGYYSANEMIELPIKDKSICSNI